MPRRCSVAGCRSNYDGEGEHVTTFVVPKTEPLRSQWLRKIPTDLTKLKYPVVCSKHFHESCIVRVDKFLVNGEIKEFERKIPKLIDGALPTIFPNLPSYLTSNASCSRRLVDAEEENFQRAVRESLVDYRVHMEQTTFHTLSDIVKYLISQENKLQQKWLNITQNSKLHVCLYNVCDNYPIIVGCIVIETDLTFDLYIDKIKLKRHKLPKHCEKICNVSTLEVVMGYVEEHVNDPSKTETLSALISELASMEKICESTELQFIIEQLKFSMQDKYQRRYSNQTLIFAAAVYVHSSTAYNALLKSRCLFLPHIRTLQSMVSQYSLNGNTISGSIQYLKTKMKHMKDHELLVNLLIDEIYIDPQLSFKAGSLYGYSNSNPEKMATTAQVFMISSLVSSYNDVVCIVPVYNLTAEFLKPVLLSVITEIEGIGFRIISVISDNNAVNRKTFELFDDNKTLQPYIKHPLDESRLLFFIFDSVHIIKCVRNNWINKKEEKTFLFPDMENEHTLRRAQFKHLEVLYDMEKNSVLKYGHLLSNKVLYPSSIQKQNVKLALSVFHEKNIAALKCVANDHPARFPDFEDTCILLEIFVTWWKIVNVKSAFEGKRFNDVYREPVRQGNDMAISFLKKMSLWLKKWRLSVPIANALTSQTFQSLITTNDAFVAMISYMFQRYRLDYLLLGKFQNDDLESRFGMYRQMSGSNYYIQYVQVLENERKLRFRSNVLLSSKEGNVSLRSLAPGEEGSRCDVVDVDIFLDVLHEDLSLEVVPDDLMPVITYIAGYTVKKETMGKKCATCTSWLQMDRSVEVPEAPFSLLHALDRGKLRLPTENVVLAVSIVWFLLQQIMLNHHDDFRRCERQMSVLHKLSCIQITRSNLPVHDTCDCKLSLGVRLENVCLVTCKILLNNYVKKENNKSSKKSQCGRKIQKLCPV